MPLRKENIGVIVRSVFKIFGVITIIRDRQNNKREGYIKNIKNIRYQQYGDAKK